MRIVRLPGIPRFKHSVGHRTLGCIIIDAGTSWYQSLQVERIQGILADNDVKNQQLWILLLWRFPCSGGANFLSSEFNKCPYIHGGPIITGNGGFFTTWANRFDSDMPNITTQSVSDGEVFVLEMDKFALSYQDTLRIIWHIVPEKSLVIAGLLIPGLIGQHDGICQQVVYPI